MLRFFWALLLLSSPAFAEDKLSCDIEIEFNSETSGIDAEVYSKIMDRIIATPSVLEKHAENLGSGGERTLCLIVEPQEIDTVYEDLKTLIPVESKVTWTRIATKDGKEFKTQKPAVFSRNTDWR